jgi:hypothetical protein
MEIYSQKKLIERLEREGAATLIESHAALAIAISRIACISGSEALDVIDKITELRRKIPGPVVTTGMRHKDCASDNVYEPYMVEMIEIIRFHSSAFKMSEDIAIPRVMVGDDPKAEIQLKKRRKQTKLQPGHDSCDESAISEQQAIKCSFAIPKYPQLHQNKQAEQADIVGEAHKSTFGAMDAAKYKEYCDQYKDKYFRTDDPQVIALLKSRAISAGLLDRVVGSRVVGVHEYAMGKTLIEFTRRHTASCAPPVIERLSDKIVDIASRMVCAYIYDKLPSGHRKKTDWNFTASETVLYFRKGMCGKPDLVYHEGGRVVSIIEVKTCSKEPSETSLQAACQQAALYMLITKCEEAFVYVHPASKAKFASKVIHISAKHMMKLFDRLEVQIPNFETARACSGIID